MVARVPRKLLLAESDTVLRQTLSEQLRLDDEFAVVEAGSGRFALEKAREEYFDALLIASALPDLEGRELCRLLRRANVRAPIIMLAAAADEAAPVIGADAGANDYVVKPFRLGVLLARLRAQLRQQEQSEEAVLTIGPFSFRPARKLLVHGKTGQTVSLTEKESQILRYLYRVGERPVSRETLLGEVWGYNSGVTTHTLETHVYRLRQKMEENPSDAALLVTEAGGYMLLP